MKIEEIGGKNCQAIGLNYRPLYERLTCLPGVFLPQEPSYFWTGAGIYAEFILNGHTFQIEADPFEDALWISPKDGHAHPEELRAIQEHLQKLSAKP